MTFRSTFAALALLGLVALSPFVSPAQAAEQLYVVNYRADAASPWLVYTTTSGPAQARRAVAELEALGYQAEYFTEPVGPVYSAGTYSYAPGSTYYSNGGSHYNHYQYNDHTAYRYHYHHADNHHSGHHHAHHHRSDSHHHDIHHHTGHHHHAAHHHPRHPHHVAHHHPRDHHTGHHGGHHHR
jgi:hypothetical protein